MTRDAIATLITKINGFEIHELAEQYLSIVEDHAYYAEQGSLKYATQLLTLIETVALLKFGVVNWEAAQEKIAA